MSRNKQDRARLSCEDHEIEYLRKKAKMLIEEIDIGQADFMTVKLVGKNNTPRFMMREKLIKRMCKYILKHSEVKHGKDRRKNSKSKAK